MKIDGKTIPAPQNIKRREAFLLNNADKLPTKYVQAQLLKIAMVRSEKKLRWETHEYRLKTQAERIKETSKTFEVVAPKQTLISRIKNMFKSQRGQ